MDTTIAINLAFQLEFKMGTHQSTLAGNPGRHLCEHNQHYGAPHHFTPVAPAFRFNLPKDSISTCFASANDFA